MTKPLARPSAATAKNSGRERPRRGLTEFDWAPLVKEGFFRNVITAYVGAGLGLILFQAQDIERLKAPLVLIDPWLSAFCAIVAFTRVWKSIREEAETSDQWDEVNQSKFDRAMDRIFEVPYLFAITVLPFATIVPQGFLALLVIFYFTDNFYNADLARGAAGLMRGDPARPIKSRSAFWTVVDYVVAILRSLGRSLLVVRRFSLEGARDNVMVDYYVRRSRLNFLLMVSVSAALGLTVWFMYSGQAQLATQSAFGVLAFVLLVELVIEPLRGLPEELWRESRGFLAFEQVDSREQLSSRDLIRLREIHQDAFEPAERRIEIDEMVDRSADGHGVLRVLTLDRSLIGYQYLEQAMAQQHVILRYFAIDSLRRNEHIGERAFRDLLDLVKTEYPAARYLLHQIRHPDIRAGLNGDDIQGRRQHFFRRLGCYLVEGIDYRLPAADDPANGTVEYQPLFVPLTDDDPASQLVLEEVRAGVIEMARPAFKKDDYERWREQAAAARVRIVPPPHELRGDDGEAAEGD